MDLFRAGDAGAYAYRMPALIETLQGTLLAVSDARHRDTPRETYAHISLVMRTSHDLGRTWSPAVTIRQVPEGAVGIPALLLDRRTGRVWCFHTYTPVPNTGERTGPDDSRFHEIHSDDEGKTWSEFVDLTPQIRDPSWQSMFTTSGTSSQTSEGRYLVPMVIRDEHDVVSSRNAWSDDAGKTWSIGPAMAPGNHATARFGDKLLLTIAAGANSENLTLKISEDNGASWYVYWVLHTGPSDHSTMVVLGDGGLAVLYECGEKSPYERIRFEHLQLN